MRRRSFLQCAGTFLATASLPGVLSGCFHERDHESDQSSAFPQGVASGDPRPSSVVIWTHVAPEAVLGEPVLLTAEVALEEGFETLVLQESFPVSAASDHTLRVVVEDLQPDTFYFYRFLVGISMASPTGRTRTAPALDDTREINFAVVNCQDRTHGFYSAYRQLINDDIAAAPERRIRFVLHLGDFIYETGNDPLQQPLDPLFNPITGGLIDQNGDARQLDPFPDGATTAGGITYASTLADYRHLYKQYLADPDLREARARWPFICIWDDHEFTDDAWQSEANYSNVGPGSSTDEPSQRRKVAANQAWSEYIPMDFSNLEGMDRDLHHTHDFTSVEVEDRPNTAVDDDNLADNEDNRNALASLSIYRSLRFGRLLNLVLTDNRSYRSDHAVPEDISGNEPVFLSPRVAMPLELVRQLDAGSTANNDQPLPLIFIGHLIANPRRDAPPGTMLGARQKQWWKETLLRSDARWTIWANSVPLMRFLINASALNLGVPDLILTADTWDGYPHERNELMRFLVENRINNVVSVAGDVHAGFAGTVLDDYDQSLAIATPVVTEVVCPAVSSISQFAGVEALTRIDNPSETERIIRSLVTYDSRDTPIEGNNPFVNNLNTTLLHGVNAALTAARTNSEVEIESAKDPAVNGHLVYADTDGHGYGLFTVSSGKITARLTSVSGINIDTGAENPGVAKLVEFSIPLTQSADSASISEPRIVVNSE